MKIVTMNNEYTYFIDLVSSFKFISNNISASFLFYSMYNIQIEF